MSAFGYARQFFENEVFDITPTAFDRGRAYRVADNGNLRIVILNDSTITTEPLTLTVGETTLSLIPYVKALETPVKKHKRPWLLFERPHPAAPRKHSSERARFGHQQMCRLPNYRGTRTR